MREIRETREWEWEREMLRERENGRERWRRRFREIKREMPTEREAERERESESWETHWPVTEAVGPNPSTNDVGRADDADGGARFLAFWRPFFCGSLVREDPAR